MTSGHTTLLLDNPFGKVTEPDFLRLARGMATALGVGPFTYLAVIRCAPIVFALTGGSMVWESIAKPNPAGREPLIAVGAATMTVPRTNRSGSRRCGPPGSG